MTSARQLLGHLALHRGLTAHVLRLACPVVLSSLTYTLLSVVDTAMLGRLGAVPLGASGIAGVSFFAIVFCLSAASVGTQALVARRFGEGNFEECGHVLQAGSFLSLGIALPLVVSGPWLAHWLSTIISGDPSITSQSAVYLTYRLYGAGFMMISWIFQAFFAGVGKTRHQMNASIIVTASNILLDYLLIFGHGGVPRLEIAGAALASSIAVGLGLIYYVVVAATPYYSHTYGIWRSISRSSRWIRPIARLSLPMVGQRAMQQGSWVAFFVLVARIGIVELASSNVIRSIYGLSVMIGVGMGIAASALVGQNLGASEPERAESYTWEAVKLAAYSMMTVGLLFALFPRAIFSIYTTDPEVIAAGRWPLILIGLIQVFPSIGLVLGSALQGAGNTRFVMIAETAICLGPYLPAVYVLGLRTTLGLRGAWLGEFIYWALIALVMLLKFRSGTWKRIHI